MARGRDDVAWNHTCSIVSTVLNLLANENEKVDATSLHPMRGRRRKVQAPEAPIAALKALL